MSPGADAGEHGAAPSEVAALSAEVEAERCKAENETNKHRLEVKNGLEDYGAQDELQKLFSEAPEAQGRQRKEAYPEDADEGRSEEHYVDRAGLNTGDLHGECDEGLPLPYSHECGAEAERLCQECEARAAAFCLRQACVATGAVLGDCEVAAQNTKAALHDRRQRLELIACGSALWRMGLRGPMTRTAAHRAGGEALQKRLADLVPHPAGQGPERPRARSHLRRGGWRGCSSVQLGLSAGASAGLRESSGPRGGACCRTRRWGIRIGSYQPDGLRRCCAGAARASPTSAVGQELDIVDVHEATLRGAARLGGATGGDVEANSCKAARSVVRDGPHGGVAEVHREGGGHADWWRRQL